MPCAWLSCESPLAEGESIGLVVQSELITVQLTARVEGVDRAEARNRRTPIFLERGLSIPYPNQFYYFITVTSPVRPSPSAQTDRKATCGFPAKVSGDYDSYSVLIADMSRGGARILSGEPIESSELMELSCEVDGKVVRLPARPRYSRSEPGREGLYSVGFRFEHVSRIDAARWKTRLSEAYITPSRAPASSDLVESDLSSASNAGTDLRVIANKLLAKMREVNRAERRYLRQQLQAQGSCLSPEALQALEAQLDIMTRHKEQFSDNLASTIQVMYSKIEAAEAA